MFGDFKHPLKTSIQAKWVETFRQLAPSKIFRKLVPSYATSTRELSVQEGKTEIVWIYRNYLKKIKKNKKRWKHHFSPYILRSQSIWSLHFDNNKFGPCYFELAFNLVLTISSLMENTYVATYVHCWHNWSLCSN